MVIKVDAMKILQGRPRPLAAWPNFLVTRMLTRGLFAVVNLLVFIVVLQTAGPVIAGGPTHVHSKPWLGTVQ